jgi:hypothetical protein
MTASTAQRFAFKRSKYHAKKVRIDDFTFDSKREGAVYMDLKLLAQAGKINALEVHPRLDLHTIDSNGIKRKVCTHVVDFRFWDAEAKERKWLEVKGFDHAEGKLKRKWAEAEYGIQIEVRK